MSTSELTKRSVMDDVRYLADKWIAPDKQQAACCYWAGLTTAVLNSRGIAAATFAGTAMFRSNANDPRDRFTYQYEPGPAWQAFGVGRLPEMHAWTAIRDEREYVDLTTGYQQAQCRDTIGLGHPFDYEHDEFYWGPESECHAVDSPVIYEMDYDATRLYAVLMHGIDYHNFIDSEAIDFIRQYGHPEKAGTA